MVYQKRRKTQQGLAMTYSTPQRASGSFDVIVAGVSMKKGSDASFFID